MTSQNLVEFFPAGIWHLGYHDTSNVGNEIVDDSDVSAAPTTSSFST